MADRRIDSPDPRSHLAPSGDVQMGAPDDPGAITPPLMNPAPVSATTDVAIAAVSVGVPETRSHDAPSLECHTAGPVADPSSAPIPGTPFAPIASHASLPRTTE